MNTKLIYVFATWKVRNGELDNVLNLLENVTQQTRSEPGNLFYDLHQSMDDPHTIILYEGYAGEEALTAHRNAEHFKNIVVEKIVPLLESRQVIISKKISGRTLLEDQF